VTTAASIPEPVDAALPAEEPAVSDEARIEYDVPALQFVSALLPAMNAAAGDRLRLGVLTDLAAVELAHAKTVTEAFEIINRPRPIDRTSVDYQTLVSDAVASVATEARLRNVRLDVSALGPDNGPDIFLDGALCRGALTGMFQCLLALSPRGGTGLHVNAQLTSIRPALIVEGVLGDSDPELGPEALSRFFDAGWREHPCGPNAGALLAAFAHVARVHGGRVDVKPAARGCRVTFVVPRMEG
jgi:hypothetical protein